MSQDTRLAILARIAQFCGYSITISSALVIAQYALDLYEKIRPYGSLFGVNLPELAVWVVPLILVVWIFVCLLPILGYYFTKGLIERSPRYSIKIKSEPHFPRVAYVEILNKWSENPDPVKLELSYVRWFDIPHFRWKPRPIIIGLNERNEPLIAKKIFKGSPTKVAIAELFPDQIGRSILFHVLPDPTFEYGRQIPPGVDRITLTLSDDGANCVKEFGIEWDYSTIKLFDL